MVTPVERQLLRFTKVVARIGQQSAGVNSVGRIEHAQAEIGSDVEIFPPPKFSLPAGTLTVAHAQSQGEQRS